MKFVALVSGGKDSIFSILEAQAQGHELVACVHLARPRPVENEDQEESYMYQTAGSEAVRTLVEDCIQVPLIHYVRQGKSLQTSMVYQQEPQQENNIANNPNHDEVEDLCHALQEALDRFPSIQAVASGALLSTYQRVRIENVCQRLGLTSLSYLWRRGSQHDTLRAMIEAGMEVVLVRTAAPPGLLPRRHLNQSLVALGPTLYRLYDQYRMHVCGEGGEYESLCLFAPGLYRKRLVLDQVKIVLDESDDGVGVLLIEACHAQDLEEDNPYTTEMSPRDSETQQSTLPPNISEIGASLDDWCPPPTAWLPGVCRCEGGFWHTSAIVSPKYYPPPAPHASEVELAVQEARDVFYILEALLKSQGCTPQDVGMVHLYLSDMSHFQFINQYYRNCFGVLLPPSRSCVALGNLPQNRRVMLDCWVLVGSGEYMRRQGTEATTAVVSPYAQAALVNTSIQYRQVLHVQSLSHWAPICVGPYSQANTLLGALHFLAGSIGLRPATMTLQATWTLQLEQSWKNLAQILDALDQSSLSNHLLSGMVYVSDQVYAGENGKVLSQIFDICRRQIESNAGVVPGLIDDLVCVKLPDCGGYEDEETRKEIEGATDQTEKYPVCPLLIVSIPTMPVGAQVEVEITAAASTAAKCLPIADYRGNLQLHSSEPSIRHPERSWSAGYDFATNPNGPEIEMKLFWSMRCLGVSKAAFATVAVECHSGLNGIADFNADTVLNKAVQSLSRACSKSSGSTTLDRLVNIRLYYISIEGQKDESVPFDASARLETALMSELPHGVQPAVTIVPVHGMHLMAFEQSSPVRVCLALQAMFLDPPSLQTELWIRQERAEV